MATSTIAGSITSTDFNVIQGLKDVNGTPLTYEGTPSKTWKVGDQILKNEKEGFSVRNEDDTEYGDLIVRNLTILQLLLPLQGLRYLLRFDYLIW